MKKPYWWRWLGWHISKHRRASKSQLAEWEFEKRARHLRPGDIAVDCGANVGAYTELLARRGATVYAFEPDPFAYEILEKRFANEPNVVLINKAVGASDGSARLYRQPDFHDEPVRKSQSSSLLEFKSNVDSRAGILVEQIDLAAFLISLNKRVALLKMDVEGLEFEIMSRLLDSGAADLVVAAFVETHEDKIPELRSAAVALRSRIALEGRTAINLNWR